MRGPAVWVDESCGPPGNLEGIRGCAMDAGVRDGHRRHRRGGSKPDCTTARGAPGTTEPGAGDFSSEIAKIFFVKSQTAFCRPAPNKNETRLLGGSHTFPAEISRETRLPDAL